MNEQMNEQLLTTADRSIVDLECLYKKKEDYYRDLLDDIYIEEDYQSKTVNCTVCNDNFYYINSKEELMKLVDTIDENGDFPLEMVKLVTKYHYPGQRAILFNEEEQKCLSCYNQSLNFPTKSVKKNYYPEQRSVFSRLKSIFGN